MGDSEEMFSSIRKAGTSVQVKRNTLIHVIGENPNTCNRGKPMQYWLSSKALLTAVPVSDLKPFSDMLKDTQLCHNPVSYFTN